MQNFVYFSRCNALKIWTNALLILQTSREKKKRYLKIVHTTMSPCSTFGDMHSLLSLKHVCALKNGCKQWQAIGFISQMGLCWTFFLAIFVQSAVSHCSYSAIMNNSIRVFFSTSKKPYDTTTLHLLVRCQIPKKKHTQNWYKKEQFRITLQKKLNIVGVVLHEWVITHGALFKPCELMLLWSMWTSKIVHEAKM